MSNTKIIKKINELYILKRSKFLIMSKSGEYSTIQFDGKTKRNQILDWRVNEHLQGKATLGVFSGSVFTKFICFDVDVKDKVLAKWTVYKLIDSLTTIGIPLEYIYTSLSGSKGYHVEIFFDKPVYNKDINKLYLMTLNHADLLNIDYGKVELRPLEGNGVKIPLGKHMKANNICWYCDYLNELKEIKKYDYILNIKQLDSQVFHNLLNLDEYNLSEEDVVRFEDDIKSRHNPLAIYKENIDEDITIDTVQDLIINGLTMTGTRHNSLLKVAKYCKYTGLNNDEAELFLIEWMKKQDKRLYTTEWDDVIKDIQGICNSKYYDKYTLTIRNTDISITKQEIEEILKVKGKNEQLILYSLLIHHKRYATNNGEFYMTYDQMNEASGLSRRTAIRLVKKLEELELIQVTRDDNIPVYNPNSNKPLSKPNRYLIKILLSDKSYKADAFNVCDKNCSECYNACLCKLFTNEELKAMLPRRQYEDVINFRDYCSA